MQGIRAHVLAAHYGEGMVICLLQNVTLRFLDDRRVLKTMMI
jgi:hypothetical protein